MNTSQELRLLDEYLILKNYAKSTRECYATGLRQFFDYHKKEKLSLPFLQDHAKRYILYRYSQGKKWQTINGDYSALRIYYQHIKGYEWDYWSLPRPRKEKHLPNILSKEQILQLINGAMMYKHQVMIALYYSTGMRLSEVLHLKISDIDGDRCQIHIRRGKGHKDRYVDIPKMMLEELRLYYQHYKPEVYLFAGKKAGSHLSPRAFQHGLNGAKEKAGIIKQCSAHTLRHSYATHHLENGTALVYLQMMLGHKHLKTTAKYIHLCQNYHLNVNHPIEKMAIKYRRD